MFRQLQFEDNYSSLKIEMRPGTKRLLNSFKHRVVANKLFLALVVAWVVYLLLVLTLYLINKFNIDKQYFEVTYRNRHLDQYNSWDDSLLSPREVALTEGKPPTLVFI